MSLQLKKVQSFAVVVHVSMPSDDPAKPNEGSFTARFKYLTAEEYNRVAAEMDDLNQSGQVSAAEFLSHKANIVKQVLMSVEGIADENGQPYPPETQLAFVLDNVPLTHAAYDAFFAAYRQTPAKNSKPSRRR